MGFQKPSFITRNRGRLFFNKIIMHDNRAAFRTEPASLPRLVVHGEGLCPYAAYGGVDFHIVLKKQLIHKVIVRMRHYKRPRFMGKVQVRRENPEQRVTRKFKPYGKHGIIDMPKSVNISESGAYSGTKHSAIVLKTAPYFKVRLQKRRRTKRDRNA
jgi:hypothetical protein